MSNSNLAIYNPARVIVQGITGRHGRFHTERMLRYGTPLVAGTSPGKQGHSVHGLPVYSTIRDLTAAHGQADASVIFVPPAHAAAAMCEAIEAEIPLIVCITEGVPVHDMLAVRQQLAGSKSQLIGPNCPGVLVPGGSLLGIIPGQIATPGSVAIVSRSGTLTYEAMAELSRAGLGQRVIVGIGGDPISGTSFVDCLKQFMGDESVRSVVMIGEIGGTAECDAADYIAAHGTKPVTAYIAGASAPAGVQMGHAGAILGSQAESAQAKRQYLAQRGITTVSAITDIVTSGSIR